MKKEIKRKKDSEISIKHYRNAKDMQVLIDGGVYHCPVTMPKIESALMEVFLRLPPEPYANLFACEYPVTVLCVGDKEAFYHSMFLPCPFWRRHNEHKPITFKNDPEVIRGIGQHFGRFVVLHPKLERRTKRYIIGVIAHELAHAYVKDKLISDTHEEDAYRLAYEWGFRDEIRNCGGHGNPLSGKKTEKGYRQKVREFR